MSSANGRPFCPGWDELVKHASHQRQPGGAICLVTCFTPEQQQSTMLNTFVVVKPIRHQKSCNLINFTHTELWQSAVCPMYISIWSSGAPDIFSRQLGSFFNTLRPRQNGRHFADDIFKRILFNENVSIAIKISLKFVPKGSINDIPALVQIMAWRRPGDKPLSEPMMVNLPTHICVTRPEWVNCFHKITMLTAIDSNYCTYEPLTQRPVISMYFRRFISGSFQYLTDISFICYTIFFYSSSSITYIFFIILYTSSSCAVSIHTMHFIMYRPQSFNQINIQRI